MNLKVYFDEGSLTKWLKATYGIEQEVERSRQRLPRLCAMEYSQEAINAINTQKYSYREYNIRYAAWKGKFGRYTDFWRLMGDLVRSIRFFQVDGEDGKVTWMGGIPASSYDSGGKSWFGDTTQGKPKKIAMYGFVMEYGGYYPRAGYHPPRPLFRPVGEEYAETKWIRKGEEALARVASRWR